MQRGATKLIPGIRGLSYEERLKKLDMFSLRDRCIRGDLIETFKVLNNIDKIDYKNLFELSQSVTKSNGLKLKGQRFNTDFRENFLT